MKKVELERILKQNGWCKVREGRHEIWGKDGLTVPLPRHKGDIPKGTVANILKRTGISDK